MTVAPAAPDATGEAAPARPPRVWPLLAAGAAAAAGYALFFAVPYLVNDLGRFPLDEVAGGAHDPKGYWPAGSWFYGGWSLGALLTLTCGPLAAAGATLGSAGMLLTRRRTDRRGRLTLVAALLLGVVALGWALSPTGSALVTWFMD